MMRSLYKRKFTPIGAQDPIPIFLKGKKRYPPPSANDSIKPKDKHNPEGRKRYVFIMTKSTVIMIASILLILAIVAFIGGFLVYKSMHDHKTAQPAPIIIHNHSAPADKVYPIHINTSEKSSDQITDEEKAFAQAQGGQTKDKEKEGESTAKPKEEENPVKAKMSDSQKKFHQLVGLEKKKGTDKEKDAKKEGASSEKKVHKEGDEHAEKTSSSSHGTSGAHSTSSTAETSSAKTVPTHPDPTSSSSGTSSGHGSQASSSTGAAAPSIHHGALHPPHKPTKLPTRTPTFYNYDVEYYGDSLIRRYQARRHELQQWENQSYNSLKDQSLKTPTYQQFSEGFGSGNSPLNATQKKKPHVIKPLATLHDYKDALNRAHHYQKMGQPVKILKHYDEKKGISYSIVDSRALGGLAS